MRLAPPRPKDREPMAIDLGTARTRIRMPGRGVSVEAPSVLAYDGRRAADLAGWEAWSWHAGQRFAPDAPLRLLWPLHAGMVINGPACRRLIHLLLQRACPRSARRGTVLLGVPVAASEAERDDAVAAVTEATGGEVVAVEEPLAAAIGTGLDVSTTSARLVVDIGAGVTEVAVVQGGRVPVARSLRGSLARTSDVTAMSGGEPAPPLPPPSGDALNRLAAAIEEMLDSLTSRQRADVTDRGLLLSGGGVLVPGLPAQLSATARLTVTTASLPAHATINGLTRSLATDTPATT